MQIKQQTEMKFRCFKKMLRGSPLLLADPCGAWLDMTGDGSMSDRLRNLAFNLWALCTASSGVEDPELVIEWRLVAAIAVVAEDALKDLSRRFGAVAYQDPWGRAAADDELLLGRVATLIFCDMWLRIGALSFDKPGETWRSERVADTRAHAREGGSWRIAMQAVTGSTSAASSALTLLVPRMGGGRSGIWDVYQWSARRMADPSRQLLLGRRRAGVCLPS